MLSRPGRGTWESGTRRPNQWDRTQKKRGSILLNLMVEKENTSGVKRVGLSLEHEFLLKSEGEI